MAGDILGNTVLTGLIVTSTPGSAQTNLPLPVSGGPAVVQFQSGVTVQLQASSQLQVASGATVAYQGNAWSIRTLAGDSSLASIGPTNADCAQVGFVLRASGMSLIIRSGNTVYHFNSAASGAAV